jgi:hypothetical protein
MRECANEEMRDVLPEFAAERLSGAERGRVAAHVATCATCAAELELLRAARRAMSRGVPTIDVAGVVAALPKPPAAARPEPTVVALAQPPQLVRPESGIAGGGQSALAPKSRRGALSRTMVQWGAWRIAAAATIAVGGLSVAVLRTHSAPTAATSPAAVSGPAVSPPPGVGGTQSSLPVPGQLDGAPAVESGPGLAVSSDISELSDGDVETLLQDMTGMDAEPSAEPDAAAPAMPAVVSQ